MKKVRVGRCESTKREREARGKVKGRRSPPSIQERRKNASRVQKKEWNCYMTIGAKPLLAGHCPEGKKDQERRTSAE